MSPTSTSSADAGMTQILIEHDECRTQPKDRT